MFLFSFRAVAQNPVDTSGLYDMSIEQLMQLKAFGVSSETEKLINSLISTASNRPLSSRETPNIVTVITADEIRRSGARDLIDVLRLVPGIDLGHDVEGVVSMGVRGLWAGEGKVLMLVDGQEVNEILYGFTPLGNEFPIERISRIEIIRGAGSIVNGGFAEYAVINIITDAFDKGKVASIETHGGATSRGVTKHGFGGQVWFERKELLISARFSHYDSERSDRIHTDVFGNTHDRFENSLMHNQQASLNLQWRKLRFTYAHSDYFVYTQNPFDSTYANLSPYQSRFLSHRFALNHSFSVHKKWTIDPSLNYTLQSPWENTAYPGYETFQRTVMRAKARVNVNYKIKRKMALNFGAQFFMDHARVGEESYSFDSGEDVLQFYNTSGFAEFSWKTRFVNILTGARFDYNSGFGSALVPRIAFTKKLGQFNYKVLYNESFKAPTIANVDGQTESGIRAELNRSFEIELGYLVGRKGFISANVFRIMTRNPIVYYYDEVNDLDQYINGPGTGSSGGELEFNYRDSLLGLRFCYSYYVPQGIKIETMVVPGQGNLLLAFPAHKLSMSATLMLPGKIAFNISTQFLSERYGYTANDSVGNKTLSRFAPELMLNAFVSRNNLFKGLDIGFGCHNILDTSFPFIMPYSDNIAPVASLSREFSLRISYRISAKAAKN
ncbi:MAG: TonB-dependent receptor plug domain-containing protein [Bacteroidia bacterium]